MCALQELTKLKLLAERLLLTIVLQQEVKKNKKFTKSTSFVTNRELLTWLLTLRQRMPDISGFLDYFSNSYFLATPCLFLSIGLSQFNYGLNFRLIQSNFCYLYVPLCCYTANQQSKIGCVFLKSLENSAHSMG